MKKKEEKRKQDQLQQQEPKKTEEGKNIGTYEGVNTDRSVVILSYHTGLSDPDAAPAYPAQLAAIVVVVDHFLSSMRSPKRVITPSITCSVCKY